MSEPSGTPLPLQSELAPLPISSSSSTPLQLQSFSSSSGTPLPLQSAWRSKAPMSTTDPSASGNPVSIVAADPRSLIKGSIRREDDLEKQEDVLRRNAGEPSADRGFPLGGLCGWVDYEGGFVFGD